MTPKSELLIQWLLERYAKELEAAIASGLDEDSLADASNDLGFVQSVLRGFDARKARGKK